MISIKEILRLTPSKMVNAVLLIAVATLWYKLETVEVKGDGKDEKKEAKQEKSQAKLDSIQNLRLQESRDCAEEKQAMRDQEIEDLKRRIAEQNTVRTRARRTEQVVNNVINETKTKLSTE